MTFFVGLDRDKKSDTFGSEVYWIQTDRQAKYVCIV